MSYLWTKFLTLLDTLGEKVKHVIENTNSIVVAVTLLLIVFIVLNRLKNLNHATEMISNSTTTDDELFIQKKTFPTRVQVFKRENLITLRDFYLLPEGLKQFQNTDWRNIFRVFRSLIKSDESLRRYYGNKVTVLPTNASDEIDGMKILVSKVHIIANEITEIDITIKNNSSTVKTLNMGTALPTLRKNETFTLIINQENSLTFEDAENINFLKNGTLHPNEEFHMTLYFRTIERGYIKNLTNIEIRLKLKYSAKGKPTEFLVPIEVDKNDFPDSVALFKKSLDVNEVQYFLSCGGFIIPTVFVSLTIIFLSFAINFILGIFGIFALWLLYFPLIAIFFAIALVIYGININSKFHQIVQDLMKQLKVIQ